MNKLGVVTGLTAARKTEKKLAENEVVCSRANIVVNDICLYSSV